MDKVAGVFFAIFLICIIWPDHVATAIRLISGAVQ